MFGRNLTLFEVAGFKVQVNVTWVFLALFIAMSLAMGSFPQLYEGLPAATYWWMAIVAVIGLFFSIVVHELAHSLVARRFGMEMRGITLFMLGGVAEMEEEPATPKAELLMALAGPAMSVIVAVAFYVLAMLFAALAAAPPFVGVLVYLATLNVVLAVFNLVPAFPLDGGRALRAALWWSTGSMRRATRIAARIGSAFGFVLAAFGVLAALRGNLVGGIWWFLIGMFVQAAATSSFTQLQARQILKGERVRRFMMPDPVTVPSDVTVRQLVDDYFYRHFHDVFPVVDDGRLRGAVGLREVKQVPKDRWDEVRIDQILAPASPESTIGPDDDALEAVARMQRTGNSRLMVLGPDGRLQGIIALKDLMKLLALRVDLADEIDDSAPPRAAPPAHGRPTA